MSGSKASASLKPRASTFSRNDCGSNPLYDQSGTWIYERGNWCPGARTNLFEHELTSFLTPAGTHSVGVLFDNYTNSTPQATYIVAGHLITYSQPNFATDVALDDILSPNNYDEYGRSNPICSNPRIVIRNTGSAPLTSATITYGIRNGMHQTYQWTGNLAFDGKAEIVLPATGMMFTNPASSVFECTATTSGDMYPDNNTLTTTYAPVPQYAADFQVVVKANFASSQNTWKITNDAGVVVAKRLTFTNNKIFRDTIHLAPGCYEFFLNDTGCDGLYFFANSSQGGGTCTLRDIAANNAFLTVNPDFGCEFKQRFTVGYSTPVHNATVAVQRVEVYPNPTDGVVYLDLSLPTATDLTAELHNAAGQLLERRTLKGIHDTLETFSLTNLPAGVYFMRIELPTETITRKVVVQH